ncbi:MAG: PAS domain-containing sensor histidine kinase, partial [Candidatus Cloacimonetes bacterium]|nr:PAS domain-containing sensor histidine kinase [Candidatus Cloacimonadota bacterium]
HNKPSKIMICKDYFFTATKQANYQKAYEYFKLYSEVKDSIFNEESSNKIAEMQTKYETEKKEKEAEISRLKNIELISANEQLEKEITERKQAEKALWKSEKKYRNLFEKSKDANLIIQNGKFVDCNQATINMLRYNNKEEFLNSHPSKLSPEIQSDGKESFIKANEMMKIAFEKGSHRFEWNHQKADGEVFPVEVLLTAISNDKKNKILYTVWRDITECKKAQEKLNMSREQLKMLNKIIRHDLSNDFVVIKSAIRIFTRTFNKKMLFEIEKRVDKSLKTIAEYKKYEIFIDSDAELIEIELAEFFEKLIIEFPKIKFNIKGEGKVLVDDALNSVFTNLITNSIKHGNSSQIDIKITSNNKICKIEFMDNGTGIPDNIKDKIFEEGFFSGKAGHTGIGLHIVKKTIDRYGGSISVKNNKPTGVVFEIKLRSTLGK